MAPGVFHDPTPGAAPSNEFNKHGVHFALRDHEGAMLFGEIGWKKQGKRDFDFGVQVGAVYHTDRFAEMENATRASLAGKSTPRHAHAFDGNYASYVIGEAELWREPDSGHDGLGAFARVVFAPNMQLTHG